MAISRKEQVVSIGRVIIIGNPNYQYNDAAKEYVPTNEDDKTSSCEILDIQEIERNRIITSKYVLPLADASILTSDEGLIYSFNCSLPYLQETSHLAEVEKNTIMQQAFLYAGRTAPIKTSGLMWVLVGILGLMSIIGMFK